MITQEELKEKLHYNQDTGIFTNKIATRSSGFGVVIGNPSSSGHLQFTYKMQSFLLHRLVFLYMEGLQLDKDTHVDHINGIKTDNRYANLRKCTRAQNLHNSKTMFRNKTGVKGVTISKGKYRGTVCLQGVNHNAGVFLSLEEAT